MATQTAPSYSLRFYAAGSAPPGPDPWNKERAFAIGHTDDEWFAERPWLVPLIWWTFTLYIVGFWALVIWWLWPGA